jgi:hypothetical protein
MAAPKSRHSKGINWRQGLRFGASHISRFVLRSIARELLDACLVSFPPTPRAAPHKMQCTLHLLVVVCRYRAFVPHSPLLSVADAPSLLPPLDKLFVHTQIVFH